MLIYKNAGYVVRLTINGQIVIPIEVCWR